MPVPHATPPSIPDPAADLGAASAGRLPPVHAPLAGAGLSAGGAGRRAVVIGAGPAGLMAAEALAAAGARVEVYDAMPSVGRKFLLAGKGGLNLTHAEPLADFIARYGERAPQVAAWLQVLGPQGLRDWAAGLGIGTFVGSSGKVFPAEMKAAPLLRAWLQRLRAQGVRFHMRHRWQGDGLGEGAGPRCPSFTAPAGAVVAQADAVVLALGGASWARLGSDGAWVAPLQAQAVPVAPLRPANCGFDLGWSEYLASRHAGTPLKNVRLVFSAAGGRHFDRLGEAVLTATGLEGNLVYAASAALRDAIEADGQAVAHLDLLPHLTPHAVRTALARGRGSRSLPNHLKETVGLSGAKAALLREGLEAAAWHALAAQPEGLAGRIKALPLVFRAPRPLEEAISTAGGVRLESLDAGLMLQGRPGVFCAGEMLDWEAPTGGYLLTAVMASGRVAGQGVLDWWARG
ncbi:TIGR03862 family flavoprotein [Ideonella livida]|uniref:TIGR03862 family flavoprotein n=1 Tax=Ideonella livida TaxID=2707176 RepID=A0A7C9PEM5_9BURK|nr:TIGR03862 family flavoprotein [Ideonella livida]NDY89632.1 TIGR03862 family flavoprotein [Ideonella livida]